MLFFSGYTTKTRNSTFNLRCASFSFHYTATTKIYTLSLHDALPISSAVLDLTEDDFDFLTSNKVWIATRQKIDRKSGSAGMPRPISYAVFCVKRKNHTRRSWNSFYLECRFPESQSLLEFPPLDRFTD